MQLEMPGQAPVSAGVLLEDPAQNRLYLRFRRDWDVIAPDEAGILSELEFDLGNKATEMGAELLLGQLQDSLSNTLTISAPREVMVEDFSDTSAYHDRGAPGERGPSGHRPDRVYHVGAGCNPCLAPGAPLISLTRPCLRPSPAVD